MIGRDSKPEDVTSESLDVVVAGHICLDLIPKLSAEHGVAGALIAPGRLIRIGPADISLGGAVANTGLALARLGRRVSLVGKIGDDQIGQLILETLRRHGEGLADGMVTAAGEASSYTIVISPPGVDRSFLHCPGANDTFDPAEIALEKLAGVRAFHFGYPPLMRKIFESPGALAELFKRIRAQGTLVSLDMAMPDPSSPAGRVDWSAWLAQVLPEVDLFIPSLEEILFMLDRQAYERLVAQAPDGLPRVADGELLDRTSAEVIAMGARMTALKLGDQGLYLRTTSDAAVAESWQDRELLAPCFVADVIGTTGSGDATIAGLLAAIVEGLSPERAVLSAVATGASSVERADATSGIPPWSSVQKRIVGWPQRPLAVKLNGRWRQDQCVWRGPHDRESVVVFSSAGA